jgi:hypothetical protein
MNGLIAAAIEQRRLLKLVYSVGSRIVEPHVYGRAGNGKELLRCYQLAGESTSRHRAGWKLLRADEVAAVKVLDAPANAGSRLTEVNRGRAKASLRPIPLERVVRVARVAPAAAPTTGPLSAPGSGKRPHDRRVHERRLRSGRKVPAQPAQIRGGSKDPPQYRVV